MDTLPVSRDAEPRLRGTSQLFGRSAVLVALFCLASPALAGGNDAPDPAGDVQQFPATGQTTCYDSTGAIRCARTGQDGEIRRPHDYLRVLALPVPELHVVQPPDRRRARGVVPSKGPPRELAGAAEPIRRAQHVILLRSREASRAICGPHYLRP